jgi:hypothetical protein
MMSLQNYKKLALGSLASENLLQIASKKILKRDPLFNNYSLNTKNSSQKQKTNNIWKNFSYKISKKSSWGETKA